MASGRNFSEDSASDTSLAVKEAQAWIEAVTKQNFKASFRESLEDGVILCELIQTIRPGCIRKINRRSNPIAHLDNIKQFLNACKELGLKDAQLFEVTDLQPPSTLARKESSNNVHRRSDAVRHIRNVCVSLFWLGNAVSTLKDYTGPQLDLKAFKEILDTGEDDEEEEEQTKVPIGTSSRSGAVPHPAPKPEQRAHSVTKTEPFTEDLKKTSSSLTPEPIDAKFGLTFEQEQTADQLLADIQNAVDEMLNTYKPPPAASEDVPPRRSPTPELDQLPYMESPIENGPVTRVTINMRSRNGGFGCQIVGGADSETQAKVELVVPGSAAEAAGLMAGDCIESIDGQNVEELSHMDVVDLIRKGGAAGGVILTVLRRVHLEVPNVQDFGVPSEVQDIAHSAEHSLDSLEWAQTINVGTGANKDEPQAKIDPEEGNKLDYVNANSVVSQEPTEEHPKPTQPAPFVQPTIARVESTNEVQKLPGRQNTSSKVVHMVQTGWAGSVEQPQQVSLLSPTEPAFPQNNVQGAGSVTQKLSNGIGSQSLSEEQRRVEAYEYDMPKVASLRRVLDAQDSTSSQAARTDPLPQATVSSYQLSGPSQVVTFSLPQSSQSQAATSQSSQPVQKITSPTTSVPPQSSASPAQANWTVTPTQISVPHQSSPIVLPPQTTESSSSSQAVTPPQTTTLSQTVSPPQTTTLSQTVSPPQTSGAPPPSSLPITPEVEHHGTLKIQKVQKTRWTPKSQGDAPRESQSEASTPAKTPPQGDQRQLLLDFVTTGFGSSSSSSVIATSTPVSRVGGSLSRNERQRQADPLLSSQMTTSTQPYGGGGGGGVGASQSYTPTHQRGVQRSMSDRRHHTVQPPLPPLPQQQQFPNKQQQGTPSQQQQQQQPSQTQVALVSHGLYATVTYKQDACSRCRRPLQPGFVMTIATHKLQYHMTCFTCFVCHAPLSYDSRGETAVLIHRGEVHCKFCSSNNQGTKTTEC